VTIKILYIDDEIERPGRDANYIKSKLEKPGEFEIVLKPPPKELPGEDLEKDYAALLIVWWHLCCRKANALPWSANHPDFKARYHYLISAAI